MEPSASTDAEGLPRFLVAFEGGRVAAVYGGDAHVIDFDRLRSGTPDEPIRLAARVLADGFTVVAADLLDLAASQLLGSTRPSERPAPIAPHPEEPVIPTLEDLADKVAEDLDGGADIGGDWVRHYAARLWGFTRALLVAVDPWDIEADDFVAP